MLPPNVQRAGPEASSPKIAPATGHTFAADSIAETWLVGFLAGKGEVPSKWVIHAGEKAGYSKDAVQRARRNLGDRVVVTNLPVVPRTTTWRLLEE